MITVPAPVLFATVAGLDVEFEGRILRAFGTLADNSAPQSRGRMCNGNNTDVDPQTHFFTLMSCRTDVRHLCVGLEIFSGKPSTTRLVALLSVKLLMLGI